MQLFMVFILSLFLTIALVPLFTRVAFRIRILDEPNERKVHVVAIPRTGGISMALGMFVPMMLWIARDEFLSSVITGAFIVFVFGLIDDIRPLKAWQKLLPQTAAALIVIFFGGVKITCLGELLPQQWILPDYLALPLTLLTILGVVNAINLSDGLDGLAGGISMLSFMLIGILALNSENMTVGVMCAAVIGGIAGFLRYNSHPAVLFMGDAGSQLLGFLMGVFAIAVTQGETPYSKVLALSIIGFPILDTLTVMAMRIKNKRSPFSPDKNHFHHRMLNLGFFHTEAVLSIYLIQFCFIFFALVTRFHSEWFHLAGFVGFSTVILGFFYAARKTGWRFHRGNWFDLLVKQRLKSFKEQKVVNRVAFGGVRYLFFLLLGVLVMIPDQVPLSFSLVAMALILLAWAGYIFHLDRFKNNVLRFSVHIMVPPLVYLSEIAPGSWIGSPWVEVINLGYITLVFFVVMTLNLTRRRHGFKITPLDVLVFVTVLGFSNIPAFYLQEFRIGMMLTKGLILVYSFDVLIGELRGSTAIISKPVVAVLVLLTVRGLL